MLLFRKMSDSYTLAALRGLGMEDGDDDFEEYLNYNDAALNGFGKIKMVKGSPEARAYMARLRAMRGKNRAGKKNLKGGIAFSTIAAALGLIPTAYKIYHMIKGSGKTKGGRALYLDTMKRDSYIQSILDKFDGRKLSALWPYTLEKARIHAEKRKKRMSKEVRDYLEKNGMMENALVDTKAMKQYIQRARAALDAARPKSKHDDSDIVYPKSKSDDSDIVYPAVAEAVADAVAKAAAPKKKRSRGVGSRELRSLGLPPATI